MYRLTSYATQRAPLAPVRALGLELLTTAFHSLCVPSTGTSSAAFCLLARCAGCGVSLLSLAVFAVRGGSAEALFAMLGLAQWEEAGEGGVGLEWEEEWGFQAGPNGGVEAVVQGPEQLQAEAQHAESTADSEGTGGGWMELLAGETLLAVGLLGDYTARRREAAAKQAEAAEEESCDAQLFVLLLQRYMQEDAQDPDPEPELSMQGGEPEPEPEPDGQGTPRLLNARARVARERALRAGRLKAGLVLEALATQRSAELCGKASLPTLLPMLEAMLRKPIDTLTSGASEGPAGNHAQFLSGLSAEESARQRAKRAENSRDAVDTLQLVLGVLLAIFDPEVEQMADWSMSVAVEGGNAIDAAAAILAQLQRLADSAGASASDGAAGDASGVHASAAEALLRGVLEQEAAAAAELAAAAQLAAIARMRILAALSSASDSRPEDAEDDSGVIAGAAGSVEALAAEARHGVWTRTCVPTLMRISVCSVV